MKYTLFSILFFAVFLGACTYTGEFKEVQTDGLYTISYPDYMKPSKQTLHENAILEYNNRYRNIYSVVVRDEKELDFLDYQQKNIGDLKNYDLLLNPLVTDSVFAENPTSILIELYGIMDEENIYYWHKTIESTKYYYQIIVWTRSMDRKQRYGPDIEKMIDSFKAFK